MNMCVRKPAACVIALGLALLVSGPGSVWADSTAINEAIGGSPSQTDGGPPAENIKPPEDERMDKEAWPVTGQAISAVRVITGRPLNGADCRDVIFEAKPMVRERHEVSEGQPLEIGLRDLCLFGLRNDSDDRGIVVRVGESLDAIAIVADPRLFAGLELAPYQQVSIPTRPLGNKRLTVSLEILWAADLKSADAQVQSVNLVFQSR